MGMPPLMGLTLLLEIKWLFPLEVLFEEALIWDWEAPLCEFAVLTAFDAVRLPQPVGAGERYACLGKGNGQLFGQMFEPANCLEMGCGQQQSIVLRFPVMVRMQPSIAKEGDEGLETGFAVVAKSWDCAVFVMGAVGDLVEKCR